MTPAAPDRRPASDVGPLLSVALLLLILFGALTWFVEANPILRQDVALERAIQDAVPASVASLAGAISWVGFPPESDVIDILILIVLYVRHLRWQAVCGAFAAGGSAVLWFALTPLIHRPRPTPDLVRVAAELPFGSFPSGHVLNLTAFFGFLAYLAITEARAGLVKMLSIAICAILVASIGFSRIYAGEHWPTDVLGGYILGAAWLLLTISLYRWRAHRVRQPGPGQQRL